MGIVQRKKQRPINGLQATWKAMKVLPVGDGRQRPLDGDVLIVAPLEEAAPVLEGHGGKAVAPGVPGSKGAVPGFARSRVLRQLLFDAVIPCLLVAWVKRMESFSA
jgi:hypothetical protein